jgi:hypothetical protein
LAAHSFGLTNGGSITLLPGSVIGTQAADYPIGNIANFAAASWMVGLDASGIAAVSAASGPRAYTIPTSVITLATSALTAAGSAIATFASVPSSGPPLPGVSVTDLTSPSVIPVGTTLLGKTGTTATLSANVTGAGIGSGDIILFGGLLPPGWSGLTPAYFGGTGPNYANV